MEKSTSNAELEESSSKTSKIQRYQLKKSLSVDMFAKVPIRERQIEYKYKLSNFTWSINISDEGNASPLRLDYYPLRFDESKVHKFLCLIGIFTNLEMELHKFRIEVNIGCNSKMPLSQIFHNVTSETQIRGLLRTFHIYLYTIVYCNVLMSADSKHVPNLNKGIDFMDESEYKNSGNFKSFFLKLRSYIANYEEESVSEGYPFILSLIYLKWIGHLSESLK